MKKSSIFFTKNIGFFFHMIKVLYYFSQNRIIWFLLALTTLTLESVALYMQHIMLLKPCVWCIYQRCTLYGLLIASLVGIIAPKTPLRFVGLAIWIYSALQGLLLAINYLNTSSFIICDNFSNLPILLPLYKWLPLVFNTNNSYCTISKLRFFSIEMPQLMIIIFIFYLIIAVIILVAQILPLYKDKLK
nr:disulfide bond formation protein DsbB [secondary endosymbiont of Trabutina mannipara]